MADPRENSKVVQEYIDARSKQSGIKTESECEHMSTMKIMKNLLVLSTGFLFLFSAFMALTNLQSSMNNAESIGVKSQSTIYIAFMASSFLLPKLVIKRLGCKLTVFFSILTYSPFIAANFYPTLSSLIPTAVLLGAGAGTLWCSANTYLNDLSFLHARGDAAVAALTTSKFFGIFYMFFQTTQIWGNLVSFYVLRTPRNKTYVLSNLLLFSNQSELAGNVSCGAEFCGGIDHKLPPLPDEKRYMLIGIYLALSLLAGIIVFVFLDSLKPHGQDESTTLHQLAATFNQLRKPDQLLLVTLTTYYGLEQGFIFGDYSEAYVACARGLENVGLVFVCFGITNSAMCFCAGKLIKCIPRVVLIITAACGNIGVCIALMLWIPRQEQVLNFYVIVGFWGISDAIWGTQLSALYGTLFRANEEAAFANYRLFEALGWLIAFSCSSQLCASTKIYMQLGILTAGMLGYLTLEIRIFQRMKSISDQKPLSSLSTH